MSDRPSAVVKLGTTLTARELEVLELASRGLTNESIADHLEVTVHSIKFHLASIYRKLGVSNRTQAAAAYLQSAHATRRNPSVERATP